MTGDGERLAERPVERRLRQALDARADSIDVRRLRPAAPPGSRAGRLRAVGLRRFALPLAGLAAAAAAGVGYLLLAPDPAPGPVLPATPPRITAPGPSSEDPKSPTPQPSVSGGADPGRGLLGEPVRFLVPRPVGEPVGLGLGLAQAVGIGVPVGELVRSAGSRGDVLTADGLGLALSRPGAGVRP
ncbi:hypothetical protein ACIQZO_04015 [Streptomyces sp. NPDC097617]|uniref:hypothetical protein n=1 Tax=Streptomyces sp. NPDC097617 TaxID=3366091 RepID=UPI0038071F9C